MGGKVTRAAGSTGRAAATLAVMALILGGCGGKASQSSTAGKPAGDAPRPVAVDPDMVTAVSTANSATPISLKFRIQKKPVVGQPVSIELSFLPAAGAGVVHIHTAFQVSDGLQLASERAFDVEQPEAGVPLEHELTVLPQAGGVLQITATVIVDSDNGGSLARSYAIPLIADGPPAA